MALVISGDVVLAGQPYRQNVCRRGVAVRSSEIEGALIDSYRRGVVIEETSMTGRIIESTRLPAIRWRLCVKPVGTA